MHEPDLAANDKSNVSVCGQDRAIIMIVRQSLTRGENAGDRDCGQAAWCTGDVVISLTATYSPSRNSRYSSYNRCFSLFSFAAPAINWPAANLGESPSRHFARQRFEISGIKSPPADATAAEFLFANIFSRSRSLGEFSREKNKWNVVAPCTACSRIFFFLTKTKTTQSRKTRSPIQRTRPLFSFFFCFEYEKHF